MQIFVIELWDHEATSWEDYMGFGDVAEGLKHYNKLIEEGFSVRMVLHVHMQEHWSKADEIRLS